MRVALAQINPTIGDFDGNVSKALGALQQAREQNAHLVVLPEMTTIGYPPRDLLLRDEVIARNLEALNQIAAACTDVAAVVGFVDRNTSGKGLPLYNAAAFCSGGQVSGRHHKSLLPTYDVFDESRYFRPADNIELSTFVADDGRKIKLGISVCEDLWNDEQFLEHHVYQKDPIEHLTAMGADVLINISASPFWIGKQQERLKIFSQQVSEHGKSLIYVNQVGGNDDLLFDGGSVVFDSSGQLIAQAAAFEEDLLVVDMSQPDDQTIKAYPADLDSLIDALVLGTRDYITKCCFKEVVFGLSGGIDSAVTAAIAARAVRPESVHGIALPSRHSSQHSLVDAQQLASNLGIDIRVIPINNMHAAAEESLREQFRGTTAGITEENIQARIRAQVLMALSNKFGWLLLTTGNKSELAVGYCTLYGDMCGGLAVISDVAKTTVYDIARRMNQQEGRELIPDNVLTKPPSAELKPDQTDQDSLPPYEVLDELLYRYVERQQSAEEIISAGFDRKTVVDTVRKVDLNEYKRRQAPPGLKVTARAFGIGWRMPIAARINHF